LYGPFTLCPDFGQATFSPGVPTGKRRDDGRKDGERQHDIPRIEIRHLIFPPSALANRPTPPDPKTRQKKNRAVSESGEKKGFQIFGRSS
jgi:hypothetical protein